MTDEYIIVTDGSCNPNPGKGAWAYILIKNKDKSTEIEVSGVDYNVTNNQMEMMAAIKALETITEPSNITIYSDSEYLIKGITSWVHKWKNNNWRTSAKTDVLNKNLWEKLDKLVSIHNIDWKWVKGHNGNIYNERVDKLAQRTRETVV